MIVQTIRSIRGDLLILEAMKNDHFSVVGLEGGQGLRVCLDVEGVQGLGECYIAGCEG